MTVDALDNGGDDSFPHLPRDADGFLDTERMPVGQRWQNGRLIDVTPSVRLTDGREVPVTDVLPPPP